MTADSDNALLDCEIGGLAVREWETRWQPVVNGFHGPHDWLRNKVGLARVRVHGKIQYIFRATEYKGGGLKKGLKRISGPEQTGNAGFGAQMIRAHLHELNLEVLCVGSGVDFVEITKNLKNIMMILHDPEWNRPARKRVKKLRSTLSL